ncbi:MAG: transcriptional repressor, partial [Pseudomonadota bacterium]
QVMEQVLHFCQQKRIRLTGIRRQLLEMIWNASRPIKAYDLLEKIRAGRGYASPPTIYRALDFLLHHGLIHKLSGFGGYVGCSHPGKHQICSFLLCKECGLAYEKCDKGLASAINELAVRNHFTARHTVLEINGLCASCRSANPIQTS